VAMARGSGVVDIDAILKAGTVPALPTETTTHATTEE